MASKSLQHFEFTTIISLSLGIVVTNAWDSLFQNVINYYFPDQGASINAQFGYTVTLTLVSSLVIYFMLKYVPKVRID